MLSFSKTTVFTMNYAAAIFIPFWHRAGSVAEQSRAEPSRAGLSRAEPSRAEQGQAEPSRASAETSRAEIRGGKYTLLCCGGFREGLLTSPRHNQPTGHQKATNGHQRETKGSQLGANSAKPVGRTKVKQSKNAAAHRSRPQIMPTLYKRNNDRLASPKTDPITNVRSPCKHSQPRPRTPHNTSTRSQHVPCVQQN